MKLHQFIYRRSNRSKSCPDCISNKQTIDHFPKKFSRNQTPLPAFGFRENACMEGCFSPPPPLHTTDNTTSFLNTIKVTLLAIQLFYLTNAKSSHILFTPPPDHTSSRRTTLFKFSFEMLIRVKCIVFILPHFSNSPR